mmetsp:Transcript_14107/g.30650  ORF Transcript_14107/g.30650 Transcript_14107/m.30650 type:complete len:222 (-) Transcript_14107:39-704(-)
MERIEERTTFLTAEDSMAAIMAASILAASSLAPTFTTNTPASEMALLLFCSAFETFFPSTSASASVCAIELNLRWNSSMDTSATPATPLRRASCATVREDSTPCTWWWISSAWAYFSCTAGSFPEEANDAKPSEPSASRPTRNTTAANADESRSSLPMAEESKDCVSIASETWDGPEEELPLFHTMTGAALVRPIVTTSRPAKIFMIEVEARDESERINFL